MKFGVLLLVLAAQVACSSVTKVKVDTEGMSQAKKVAIVGFHLIVQQPKSLMGDMQKLGDLVNGKVPDANQESDTADQVYAELSTRLQKDMNWDVRSQQDVRRNPLYQEMEHEFTTGLQVGTAPRGENSLQLRPHGILDAQPFISKVSQERREKLMDSLGVNAIVADFVNAMLSNESTFGGMIGRAKYKPKTQNIIRVYVRGKKDPVWFDTWAWGEGDEAIQASANYITDEDLLKQVKISSAKSIQETIKRYKEM